MIADNNTTMPPPTVLQRYQRDFLHGLQILSRGSFFPFVACFQATDCDLLSDASRASKWGFCVCSLEPREVAEYFRHLQVLMCLCLNIMNISPMKIMQ